MSRPEGPPAARQETFVESGFASVVFGGDLNMFGDSQPVYVLEPWREPPESRGSRASPDPAQPAGPPSRLLNARLAVVPFTGRENELGDLRQWLNDGPRLAIRWLYAPGGQGKTRLAMSLCDEAAAAGWKVLTAVQGPGTVLREQQGHDLSTKSHRGLLTVVDYADQWPFTHLTWLLSNRVFHQSATKTRILMVARTADALPELRAALKDYPVDVSGQHLYPLPEDQTERGEMFTVAQDSFAAHYGLANVASIVPPDFLENPALNLVLAIHMAALVAVDAHVRGESVPPDMAGLSCYLLDREFLYWRQLYGDRRHEISPGERAYRTPPGDMHRAVYAAALTGPVLRDVGRGVAIAVRPEGDPDPLLNDHRTCYPPSVPVSGTVLEPLFPDLLAEDLLALTMPGHDAAYPFQEWARPVAAVLLARRGEERAPAAWTPRAITFLTSAVHRWPHLGERYLFGRLREDPQLALDAGSAALSALAALPGVPLGLLEAIDSRFPAGRHVDLDPGIAAVTRRLTISRLAGISEPEAQAELYAAFATRLSYAGLHEEAATEERRAIAIYRDLAPAQPRVYGRLLAGSLGNLGNHLGALGLRDEALEAEQEAAEICRQLAAGPGDIADHDHGLANALCNLGTRLRDVGRHDESLTATQQAVPILRRLAEADSATFDPDLARALSNLAVQLAAVGRAPESLTPLQEALEIRRRLSRRRSDPARTRPRVLAGYHGKQAAGPATSRRVPAVRPGSRPDLPQAGGGQPGRFRTGAGTDSGQPRCAPGGPQPVSRRLGRDARSGNDPAPPGGGCPSGVRAGPGLLGP